MTTLIGIDTGGTFTDFIVYENEQFATLKIASTPNAPEQAILQGLAKLGLRDANLQLIHGTTVATNALLEGRGARTAFVTNCGFKDLLRIGRQHRTQLYSLCPQPAHELIKPELCFELNCRVAADGQHLISVTDAEIQDLLQTLQTQQVESVAICMLFAFLNASDEQKIAAQLDKHYFTSYSSQLLPEQREYERAMVTWLNSYLGPLSENYLSELQTSCAGQTLRIMQSDATTLPAVLAAQQPVRLLLSGPAGGVVAAHSIGQQVQQQALLTLDMGGTSTDVALIEGEPTTSTEHTLADIPLALPMLDIHTIGAGGGSIARVDTAGGLHVGPESAGADPGPACYLRDGTLPTVTDANVVLGRLPVLTQATEMLQVDKAAAKQAISCLATAMDCSLLDAARGVIALANAHMVQALRVISIHRGYDPQQFCLFPFGGSGTLHMCDIASQLNIHKILVPMNAGVLSAYGMLLAPQGQFASCSVCKIWHQLDHASVEENIAGLKQQAVKQLQQQQIPVTHVNTYLELRYQGQATTIKVAWAGEFNSVAEQFTVLYKKQFGFTLSGYAIELVTIRVWAYQQVAAPDLPKLKTKTPGKIVQHTKVIGYENLVPVYQRKHLAQDQIIVGPSILVESAGTIFITDEWYGQVDCYGHIHLQLNTERR